MIWRSHAIAALAALSLAGPPGALAQEKAFSIELNDAADVEGSCRLIYLALNETGVALQEASYDIYIFDAAGKVAQSLVFQFGSFRNGKTKVVKFDLADQPCGQISRLLVNDTIECTVDGAKSTVCLDALKTSSRTPIAFGL